MVSEPGQWIHSVGWSSSQCVHDVSVGRLVLDLVESFMCGGGSWFVFVVKQVMVLIEVVNSSPFLRCLWSSVGWSWMLAQCCPCSLVDFFVFVGGSCLSVGWWVGCHLWCCFFGGC